MQIDVALSDADLDVLSITSAGADYPASLELKLLSLIAKLSGFPLDELLTNGIFHIDVTTSMPLIAPSGLAVDGLKAIIEIADAFTLADSTVTLMDFDPAYELSNISAHEAVLVDGFLTVDLSSAPLSLLNIENGLNGSDFISPTVSFGLSAIPYGAGSETVTINLVDGLDASRDVGERQVTVALGFDWDANGTSAELTVPAQDVSAYYVTAGGVQVDVALGNADLDMLSVISSGAEYPASLEVKLLSLITKLNGLPLADLLSAGVFHVELTTSMPLIAPSGLAVEGLKAIIEIADTASDSVGVVVGVVVVGGSEADQ